jgi:hypothetical protein|tara:strand:+ start:430 stop:555 length:126 start_codon:yes stop_codon:yes gene_type:complete
MHTKYLDKYSISPSKILRDIISVINIIGVAFVIDTNKKLVG